MRRHVLVLAGAVALWCAVPLAVISAAQAGTAPAAGGAVAVTGTWRKAIEVPGTGALNKGGVAGVLSVSCASAGNCLAGGYYRDRSGNRQAFVASERNGTWHAAIEVPGTSTLNKSGYATVNSVSCKSAGNCVAGGYYRDQSQHAQAFVASERNGAWRAAIEVPGTGALNKGGVASVTSVSCASAGNCVAGGEYTDRSGHQQAFVASERNGGWRAAIEVPGTGALNKGGPAGGSALVSSVSCASAGNCVAGGEYLDGSGNQQVFVASERNGAWRAAIEVPGTGTLNKGGITGGDAFLFWVSCASAGNCAAGGSYADRSGRAQAFVASERNGAWRAAIEVPGTSALNKGGAAVTSVSCASAGNCVAGGEYEDGSGHQQAFVASERNGAWRAAIEVPGTSALNSGGWASVNSVSCSSAGNCLAGGYYRDRSGHPQAFVASQRNGTWHPAIQLPGTGALNKGGNASVNSVSCTSAGDCAAGGAYADRSGHVQAFVASQT
jgi:hypothetical protein